MSATCPPSSPTCSAQPGASSPRNFGIDLLRGLAILLVVVHHLALSFRLPLGPSLLGQVLPKRFINALSFNGYESVFLFFVISGFVITRRVLERHGSLAALDGRRFYAQRAARILPLLGLLLAVLVLMHLLAVPGYVVDGAGQSLAGALLSALTMTLNWYEGRSGWLPGAWDVLWSLSIEEVFYLAFPLLCLLRQPRWLLALLLGVLALSLPWTRAALAGQEIWQEKAYLPGMSAIACGVLAALLARRWQPTRREARGLAVLGGVALGAVFIYGVPLWRSLHNGSMLLLCAGSAALLLAAVADAGQPPRPFNGLGWLARMGQWSYEIYLSHMFVVLSLTSAYLALLGRDLRWTFLVYPPALLLCVLLGRALHRGFSQPAERWLKRRLRA